jgi:hypothetical protein
MRTMEERVDLDAVHLPRIALQMRALAGKAVGIPGGNRPARHADPDLALRHAC